ncbi:hypothetical protein ACFL3Q_10490 [Planctomycetota bacterium]
MNFDAKKFLQSLFGIQISEDLPQEWIEDYEERAAILEFEGGYTRREAEAKALCEIQARNIVKK